MMAERRVYFKQLFEIAYALKFRRHKKALNDERFY
jgi:hypothetical protein